jgi:hypothetical protein
MLKLIIKGREQSRTSMYFDLTRETYERVDDNFRAAANYRIQCHLKNCKCDHSAWGTHFAKGIREFLVQHLFAAMCLEAFIYDYAATNFTDSYAKKYLDKLDLVAKWVVIPKLALCVEFPKDSQAFEYLRAIKKERDKLVHSKSRAELSEEEREKEIAQYDLTPSRSFKDSDIGGNVFRQLVGILETLKDLEMKSGRQQDWWQIIEVG